MARKQVGKPAFGATDAISKADLDSAFNGAAGYLTQVKQAATTASNAADSAGASATTATAASVTAAAARDAAEAASAASQAAQEDTESIKAYIVETAQQVELARDAAADSAARAEYAASNGGGGGKASNGIIRDTISLRTSRLPEDTPPFDIPAQDRIITWDMIPDTVYVPMERLNRHLAKSPETLIQGAVIGDPISSAGVVWPDDTPGIFSVLSRHESGAITSYEITYGSPVQQTYTQPPIERTAAGVPTSIPAIVVTSVAPDLSNGDVVNAGAPYDPRPVFVLSGGTPLVSTPSLVLSGGAP